MKKLCPIISLCCSLLVVLVFHSCSDDDMSGSGCDLHISGNVVDIQTGDLLDLINVTVTRLDTSMQNVSHGSISSPQITQSGKYDIVTKCGEIGKVYTVNFYDTHNMYISENIVLDLKNEDINQDVAICPKAFLALNLKRISASDSLLFFINGLKCDEADREIKISSWRNFKTDTTSYFHLPTSSQISIQMKSYGNNLLNIDTTFVFPTFKGDTVFIDADY